MKRIIIPFLILAVFINACGQPASGTVNSNGQYSSEINTQIAQALTSAATPVQETLPTATATLPLLATPTPTQTTLSIPTPTVQPKIYATPMVLPTGATGYSECDNADYISDITIKDGTVLMPGEPFKKIWRLKNNGSCAWRSGYTLVFVSGYEMEGEAIPINQYVAPGEDAKIHLSLIAPNVEGTYTGYWIMMNREGKIFGETIFVQIVVSEDETEEEPE